MKSEYPRNKAQFKTRCERLIDDCRQPHPFYLKIAPIARLECQLIVEAYFGGKFQAVWGMFKEAVFLLRHQLNNRFLIWFSDTMGWTKLHHFPECEGWREHWSRHGSKCSGSPNCRNDNCIEDSQPNWFKRVREIGQPK